MKVEAQNVKVGDKVKLKFDYYLTEEVCEVAEIKIDELGDIWFHFSNLPPYVFFKDDKVEVVQ